MKNKKPNETLRVVSLFGWTSPVLTISFVLLCIYLLIDSIHNGSGMRDMVFCFGPLFSSLKGKLTKGLNKLNSFIDGEEEEDDDEFDKKLDRLEERLEKAVDIERKLKERERKQMEKERERMLKEREREEMEEREDMEEEDMEEEDMEEREERRREYEERIRGKYERGEELTAKEKFALSLLMEIDENQANTKRILAEDDERKRREAEAKKEKRKEVLSKVGKAITGLATGGSSTSNSSTYNSQTNTSTKKNVMKVWTMRYIGQGRSDGPKYLQVPSANQCGRPTGNEIKEALLSLGYDSATAHSLANGGGESTWEVVG